MVASGIPERNDNRHTVDVAELSLDLIKTMETFRVPQLKGETLLLRIGFCTGKVMVMFYSYVKNASIHIRSLDPPRRVSNEYAQYMFWWTHNICFGGVEK